MSHRKNRHQSVVHGITKLQILTQESHQERERLSARKFHDPRYRQK